MGDGGGKRVIFYRRSVNKATIWMHTKVEFYWTTLFSALLCCLWTNVFFRAIFHEMLLSYHFYVIYSFLFQCLKCAKKLHYFIKCYDINFFIRRGEMAVNPFIWFFKNVIWLLSHMLAIKKVDYLYVNKLQGDIYFYSNLINITPRHTTSGDERSWKVNNK